jgi:hypothetical protein
VLPELLVVQDPWAQLVLPAEQEIQAALAKLVAQDPPVY